MLSRTSRQPVSQGLRYGVNPLVPASQQNGRKDVVTKKERLKTVGIVATSALPWRTGTSINPLMRAFYLARRNMAVTLYLPWVDGKQQAGLFSRHMVCATKEAQEAYSRAYLPRSYCPNLRIVFYPGKYFPKIGSILPLVSPARFAASCDWLLLEEPEHLHWLYPFSCYGKRMGRITGIVLTNYSFFAQRGGKFFQRLFNHYNSWVARWHCHDLIRIGAGITNFPWARTLNVNGVHPDFFQVPRPGFHSRSAYFMGTMLWEKGYKELIDLLGSVHSGGIDIYGDGMDRQAILKYAKANRVRFVCKGRSTNPPQDLAGYKILINTSRSEGLCTVTADALAMGKFVILPRHPSNAFFYPFKNALLYGTPEEFHAQLQYAIGHHPQADPAIHTLSWERATDRLLGYFAAEQ